MPVTSLSEHARRALCAILPKSPDRIPDDQQVPTPSVIQPTDVGAATPRTIRAIQSATHARQRVKGQTITANSKRVHGNATYPVPPMDFIDRFQKDMRLWLKCDTFQDFPQCYRDADCNAHQTCLNKVCVNNVEHCSNTGCNVNDRCNPATGVCEDQRTQCNTNDQCSPVQQCNSAIGRCVPKAGYCTDDALCINYVENTILKNKCHDGACVECVEGERHTCGLPQYGKNSAKPMCDRYVNECYPACNTADIRTLSLANDCCNIGVSNELPFKIERFNQFKQNCCGTPNGTKLQNVKNTDPSLYTLLDANCCGIGVQYFDYNKEACCLADWSTTEARKCCLPDNTFVRDCNGTFAGKTGSDQCCNSSSFCYPDGQCKP